ncbi:lipopolysaccharide assembly protein LapB [Granulicella sp. S190]|uniref:tetratricopeptide repeat protein n=1 Tax=Granulicella sp. S190 TaxID=1747226 RepID=UPI00131B29B4|nr:hypothetical protein [Granulicella sp. S190]
MKIGLTFRVLLAGVVFSAACHAQTAPAQGPPPCPASGQSGSQPATPCAPPAQTKKPSVAEQFPFPGAAAKPAAPAPDSPSPSATTPSSAATEHPFPTGTAPKLPGDDSSSSSSSSGGVDPDVPDTDMPKPGTEGSSVHRKLPKVKRVQTDDERVDEDLKVAKFYMRDDNLQGAYLRAQDAVKTQPEYSAAHYALGEIAQKMKKKDEAVAEYQTYLKLDPEGERAKDARRALDQLQ